MEPSTPLSMFMSNLLQECGCRSIEVTNDNAMRPLNSRTIILQDNNSSNRYQRSCRWGNASPASVVTNNIHVLPAPAYDKSSRNESYNDAHSSHYDHNRSPSSRWDLDADRFLNISSPTLPARKEDYDRVVSMKEQASRMAQLANRKNVPRTLRALPY
jgi:hypothetical protein